MSDREFQAGNLVQLTDTRGRHHTITLHEGAVFHSHKGAVNHDDLIGQPEGCAVTSAGGMTYLALRPILEDYVLSMGRKAAIIYPKDAFAIVGLAGIQPGSQVVEAGAGSGALSCFLLNAVGPSGTVTSVEIRPEFAEIAKRNVERWFGGPPANWSLSIGDLAEHEPETAEADAVILDMLAPWECLDSVAAQLRPGGRLVTYVATTTQLSRWVEHLRADGRWTEPRATESLVRTWHLEGLSVRPDHRMIGHTAFLVVTRRLAPGVVPPTRRRRPAPGAYGPDYTGPRPPDVPANPVTDSGENTNTAAES
ncbi:MAG: tRNA (adenine-N1)-methyltransferase [Actinomycetia bacterium]|nr:tRNA (adenine-N1)-methyltransferase [Actinomycetes bacterium]MCH9800422.1 tRNA (adenine-N1)-methyltransferase [Actinomycetes bacterium]